MSNGQLVGREDGDWKVKEHEDTDKVALEHGEVERAEVQTKPKPTLAGALGKLGGFE